MPTVADNFTTNVTLDLSEAQYEIAALHVELDRAERRAAKLKDAHAVPFAAKEAVQFFIRAAAHAAEKNEGVALSYVQSAAVVANLVADNPALFEGLVMP